MTVSLSNEEVVATHEAGHVVAAYRLRIPFSGPRAITIIPGEEYLGRFTHKDIFKWRGGELPDNGHSRLKLERVVQTALAGIEAQRHLDPSSIRYGKFYGDWDGGNDYHQAIELIDSFTSGNQETKAYLELLRIRAQNLVTSPANWACIRALAASLLQRKSLSARQAIEIIQVTMADLVARRNGHPSGT